MVMKKFFDRNNFVLAKQDGKQKKQSVIVMAAVRYLKYVPGQGRHCHISYS